MILPGDFSKISKSLTGGQDCVGIRCPNHKVAQDLIQKSGYPIAATSANISDTVSPTTALHVYNVEIFLIINIKGLF